MSTALRPLAAAALLLSAAAPAAVAQTPVRADQVYAFNFQRPITGGFTTYAFGFGGLDDPDGLWFDPGDALWTFTSSRAFFFDLLDAGESGDRFELLDIAGDGSVRVLGITSPAGPGGGCELDPVACRDDQRFSRGTFRLAPGTYAFDVRPTADATGVGFFSIQQVQVVPEPGTWVLVGSGLLALGAVARRRRGG